MRANWLLWSAIAVAVMGCGESNQLPAKTSGSYPGPPPKPWQTEPGDDLARQASGARPVSVTAPSEAMSPAQIAARASKSVVVITTGSGMGAGFVVAPDRVATCLHVIEGADRIVVRTHDRVEHAADAVIAYDRIGDVAVVSVPGIEGPWLPLGDSAAANAGDAVTVIGHPEGLESSVSTGVVSAVRKFESGFELLQVTAPISPGSSGGPVLDDEGKVIGLTRSLRREGQALNFATPVSALKKLLAADPSPIPLAQFAQMTAVKPASEAPPPPATAASAVAPAPALTSFPASVAGFTFGMGLEQAKLACATDEDRARARRNWPWQTMLSVDGVMAMCPFAPEPLDFVDYVSLQFAANSLIRIGLGPTSLQRARSRLGEKYGHPSACHVGSKWLSWTVAVERRATQCNWPFGGGIIALANGTPPLIVYISDAEDELKKQGY